MSWLPAQGREEAAVATNQRGGQGRRLRYTRPPPFNSRYDWVSRLRTWRLKDASAVEPRRQTASALSPCGASRSGPVPPQTALLLVPPRCCPAYPSYMFVFIFRLTQFVVAKVWPVEGYTLATIFPVSDTITPT
ncbi:hypothetical protein NDU88_001090 [Pleurodeles waltl]|uniref:Uncharacterized protein n=1 Tax=Pleurodeles waltl TaxID=8319 RepID=A0AAV7Q309_PLEWA|nr:hypothetical protein NDU88_001090 [Pleurodeles waltl]